MKNRGLTKFIIMCVFCIFLFSIFGCSKNKDYNTKEWENDPFFQEDNNIYVDNENTYVDSKNTNVDDKSKSSNEAVNFKCDLVGSQTMYYLKDKGKIKINEQSIWIEGDSYFMPMEISGVTYLIKYPSFDNPDMTLQNMKEIYTMSKSVPNIDCFLDVVKESDVEKPNYEVLTEDEYQQKVMDEMMNLI
jgi:hypothetical protein